MTDRWELLPGEEQAAPLYLDNLLQAQARQALAEAGFADAEFTYNLAQLNLKRATGTLLQDEQVTQARVCIDGLPAIDLHRPVGSQEGEIYREYIEPQSDLPIPQEMQFQELTPSSDQSQTMIPSSRREQGTTQPGWFEAYEPLGTRPSDGLQTPGPELTSPYRQTSAQYRANCPGLPPVTRAALERLGQPQPVQEVNVPHQNSRWPPVFRGN